MYSEYDQYHNIILISNFKIIGKFNISNNMMLYLLYYLTKFQLIKKSKKQ